MRNLCEMPPTPFSDYPWIDDVPPPFEEDGAPDTPAQRDAACALCEADDGYVCPIHASLILELL